MRQGLASFSRRPCAGRGPTTLSPPLIGRGWRKHFAKLERAFCRGVVFHSELGWAPACAGATVLVEHLPVAASPREHHPRNAA